MSGDYQISDEEFSFKDLGGGQPKPAQPAQPAQPSPSTHSSSSEAQAADGSGAAPAAPPGLPPALDDYMGGAYEGLRIPALDQAEAAEPARPQALESEPTAPAFALPGEEAASSPSEPEAGPTSEDAHPAPASDEPESSPEHEHLESGSQHDQTEHSSQKHQTELGSGAGEPAPAARPRAAGARDEGSEAPRRPRLKALRRGVKRGAAASEEAAEAAAQEAAAASEEAARASGALRRQFKGPKRSESRPIITGGGQSPRHMLQAWLSSMVKSEASDLILRAGGRPSLRVDGRITFLPGRVPGPGPLLEVLEGVMGSTRMAGWSETGSADAAIQLDGLGRFRMNAYKQMGEPAVVIRRINENAPNLEQLELPARELRDLAMRRRGLVLVTGIAGSGKSTTLAGMIQHMNENVERHIITLEDPVELMFKEKRCVISQREVGTDTPTFQEGLRHALRQSPDVIFIGEVRDAETVIAALEATETGHMVMSTMHTVNAAQTIDRILGFFPSERHKQIRQRMSDNLMGVLSQRLVPKRGELGMLPAYELMISTPHIRELIEEGKTGEIARVIETGSEAGLVSFNECLRGLVEQHKVELEDALAASDRPEELLLALRGIRGSSDRVQSPKAGGGEGANGAPKAGGGANAGAGSAGGNSSRPDGLRLAGSE